MKNILLYLLILLTFDIYAQEDIIAILKSKKYNPITTIIYTDSILAHNSSLNKKQKSEILYYQALAYQNNANHKKALQLFNEILSNYKLNSTKHVDILLLKSNSNVRFKNLTEATNQAINALEIAKKNNFNKQIASANIALSYIYYANKKYLIALSYLFNSAKLQKEQNDSKQLSATYNNIAIIYKNIGKFDSAIAYNQKSLEISRIKNDYIGIGKSYSNIGRVYELTGDFKTAIKNYKKALENNKGHKILNSIPYRNIGDVYIKIKKYDLAEKKYQEALLAENTNANNETLRIIFTALMETTILQKKFKKALIFQKKADSILNINLKHKNNESLVMLENQYKLFQSQKELAQYKSINFKNKIIFFALTGVVLIGFLFFFQKNKNNKLQIEKDKLHLEQRVLRSQMNPHFIFNALSAIQNSLLDNEPIKSAGYLSRFAKLIRQNFDFINQKTILLKEEIDALQNYMDTQKMRFNDKFGYEINVFANVDINTVEIPPILIQPFVENAIEHGFKNKKEKGIITINISKNNNNAICYEIKDNGKGYVKIKKDTKTHAIDVFKNRLKLRGLKEEKTFKISSTNKGTFVTFCLKQ